MIDGNAADIAAFDRLPKRLRAEVRRCRANVSAPALLKLVEKRFPIEELVSIVREVDRLMCKDYRNEIANQKVLRRSGATTRY